MAISGKVWLWGDNSRDSYAEAKSGESSQVLCGVLFIYIAS